jgi:hypothetical protein
MRPASSMISLVQRPGPGDSERSFEVRRRLLEQPWSDQRYRRLDRYHAFYLGEEYSHLTKNWSGLPADKIDAISPDCAFPMPTFASLPEQKPTSIHELRPTAPLRMTSMIVDRFTGLLFSEERLPKVMVEGNAEADDWLKAVLARYRFWRTMRLARSFGGAMGSALVTVRLRNGRIGFRAFPGKVVQDVVWADDEHRVPLGVLIQYCYVRERQMIRDGAPTGRNRVASYLYRRIIDEHSDIVFKPVEWEVGKPIAEPEIDEQRSYIHGLGRFPGVYVQNLEGDDELDGVPDCEGAYQLMQMIDVQISQTNRALINNQDPTLVYGRDFKLEQLKVPLQKGSENALNLGIGGYANYLEMSGSGQQQAVEFVKLARQWVLDKTQCVVPDKDDPSFGAQSGKALEFRFASMLEKAGSLREQWGEAIEQLADVVLEYGRSYRVDDEGRPSAVVLPPRIVERDADPENPDPEAGRRYELVARDPGVGGTVTVTWGPYFAKTETDRQQRIANISAAYSTQRIDGETVTRELVKELDLQDVEGVLRRVREEADLRHQQQLEAVGLAMPDEVQETVLGPDGLPVSQDAQALAGAEFEQAASPEAEAASPAEAGPEAAGDVSVPAPSDAPAAPGESTEPIAAPGAAVPDVSLNGAQVEAAKAIVADVAAGLLPRESGVAMLRHFFSLPRESAEEIMGSVGESFFSTPEQPGRGKPAPSEPAPIGDASAAGLRTEPTQP